MAMLPPKPFPQQNPTSTPAPPPKRSVIDIRITMPTGRFPRPWTPPSFAEIQRQYPYGFPNAPVEYALPEPLRPRVLWALLWTAAAAALAYHLSRYL